MMVRQIAYLFGMSAGYIQYLKTFLFNDFQHFFRGCDFANIVLDLNFPQTHSTDVYPVLPGSYQFFCLFSQFSGISKPPNQYMGIQKQPFQQLLSFECGYYIIRRAVKIRRFLN